MLIRNFYSFLLMALVVAFLGLTPQQGYAYMCDMDMDPVSCCLGDPADPWCIDMCNMSAGAEPWCSGGGTCDTDMDPWNCCVNNPTDPWCMDACMQSGGTEPWCSGGASCDDGMLNQGEVATDCGGPCPSCLNCWPDYDGDTYGDPLYTPTYAKTCDANYASRPMDCNDSNSSVNPDATEICDNQIDDDCDNLTDGDDPDCAPPAHCDNLILDSAQGETGVDCGGPCGACITCYPDADQDGYGDDATAYENNSCDPGDTETPGDCDDFDPDVFPGNTEICFDYIDNNCSSEIDEGCPPDTDFDQMDDNWETRYNLNVGVDDSQGDPDSDGNVNVKEYQAGTDPTRAGVMPPGYMVPNNAPTMNAQEDGPVDGQRPLPARSDDPNQGGGVPDL